MKKQIKIWLFVVVLFLSSYVYAKEYQIGELIPVNQSATVKTEIFNYTNFVYQSSVDSKDNCLINFESILNNTDEKQFVRINLLLFDKDQKNIGYVTYCTSKDFSSDYNDFTLSASQSSPFSINVTSRYMVKEYKPNDVRYVAVYDDNKYCYIGGYDNYAGMKIDEIIEKPVVEESKDISIDPSYMARIAGIVVIVFIGISIIVWLFRFVHRKRAEHVSNRIKKMNQPVVEPPKPEPTLDLSYDQNGNLKQDSLLDDDSNNSASGFDSRDLSNSSNTSNKDGESDLSKFFR